MSRLLTLAMMVENDNYAVEKTLLSVLPAIDRWVIQATGHSEMVIETILKTLRDIPGKLFTRFSRNEQQNWEWILNNCGQSTRWILFLKPNEEISNPSLLRAHLEPLQICNSYSLRHLNSHHNTRIFKAAIGSTITGEYLTVGGSNLLLQDVWINIGPSDKAERKRRRLRQDIRWLRESLLNHLTASKIFELGTMYIASGQEIEAEVAFRLRLTMTGQNENENEVPLAEKHLETIRKRRI